MGLEMFQNFTLLDVNAEAIVIDTYHVLLIIHVQKALTTRQHTCLVIEHHANLTI